MLAGFIAILWLVPFNSIELNVALPIDLKFDRLVLPFVAVTWLVAFAAGGRIAPRLRLTRIHVALGAFLLLAFLSVVLDAALPQPDARARLRSSSCHCSLVRLAVRDRRQLGAAHRGPAFLTYSLVLAVICAVGMIYEYRFDHNLFYDWSDKLLPGFFTCRARSTVAPLDELGRRLVRGPADVPLEAVSMLCMALPIALVGLVQATRWRGRILYSIAPACSWPRCWRPTARAR